MILLTILLKDKLSGVLLFSVSFVLTFIAAAAAGAVGFP